MIKDMPDLFGFYYCSSNDENSKYRKPNTGLFDIALNDIKKSFADDIDLANSYTIGDSETDIIAGEKIGTKTILTKNLYEIVEGGLIC